ncbi:hypothetical protein K488DRAFT_45608 [Vararia minispora EC-137]|uniref:Uncharacterized protein n=1 Tax=Vararia minispora EC-137 TaxID=1314806 RepID=A0ACB8QRS3_9AGAM|nr:hypothetical protein K488DRAFT_45608 [Vararia minispora EC-137]
MARHTLFSLLMAMSAATVALAQLSTFPATPLVSEHFPTPSDAPYHADPGNLARGNQTGYNICNSTTEGPTSLCQTAYVNDLGDFCLWGPAQPNSTIADTEGEVVAWCTVPGHGTRIMPEGTITGAQLVKTPDYWMITGLIQQSNIDIASNDTGGELDPGGQDLRGNPIGGLLYSTAFNTTEYQINNWVNFMGSNQFCIKICNPSGSNPEGYCQHTLDRIGSFYNCPSKYTQPTSSMQPGEFEICDSDNMQIPGVYVENGQTLSYSQPPESLGGITTIPYTPTIPSSSSCQTTSSAALFASATASASATGSGGSSASRTSSASGAGNTSTSGAERTIGGAGALVLGIVFSTLLLS